MPSKIQLALVKDHSAIKGNELGRKSRLQGRRVDWLLRLLWNKVWSVQNGHVMCELSVCNVVSQQQDVKFHSAHPFL